MSIKHIEAVFKNAELKPTSKLVALALADHADSETGECFPSVALMMKKTSLSKQAVISAIKNLENLGYLKVRRDPIPCRKNHYWLSAGSLLAKRWRKEDQEGSDHRVKEIDQLNTCVVKELDPLGLGARPSEDASGQGARPVRSRSLTYRVKEIDPLGLGARPRQVKELDPNHHNRQSNRQKESSVNHQSEIEKFESNYQENIYSSEVDEADDYDIADWSMIDLGEQGGDGELEGDKKKEEKKEGLVLSNEDFKKNEEEEKEEMDEDGKITRSIYTAAEMLAFKKLEEAPRLSEDDFERRRQEEREKLARLLEAKKDSEGQDAISG